MPQSDPLCLCPFSPPAPAPPPLCTDTCRLQVDTLNQALLLLGLRQSKIAPDQRHQYGYGRAAFFWGLVSALGLFWCGAGVTIFHGEWGLALTQAQVLQVWQP